MFSRKIVFGSIVCVLSVVLVGLLLAQEPAGGGAGERPARQGQRMSQEERQKMMANRMKEMLEISDADWKPIEPKLMKVLSLSPFGSRGGFGMMFRGRRGPEPTEGEGAEALTGTEKCMAELQKVLDDKEAKAEQIKEKLAALRKAKEKDKAELAKAQEELCKVLNARQEAQFVLVGIID